MCQSARQTWTVDYTEGVVLSVVSVLRVLGQCLHVRALLSWVRAPRWSRVGRLAYWAAVVGSGAP